MIHVIFYRFKLKIHGNLKLDQHLQLCLFFSECILIYQYGYYNILSLGVMKGKLGFEKGKGNEFTDRERNTKPRLKFFILESTYMD